MRSNDKQYQELVRELIRDGWTLVKGKKHAKIRSPRGRLVSFSNSPSDGYGFRNFKRDVDRVKREEHDGHP